MQEAGRTGLRPGPTFGAPAAAPDEQAAPPRRARLPALDVARGLAVVCMMYEHLVPGGTGTGFGQTAATAAQQITDGKSAPLFCMLLGIGIALQCERAGDSLQLPRHLLRRGLALVTAGWVFGLTVWPTEILMPMGLMTLLSIPLLERGGAALAVAFALLAAVPAVTHGFAAYVDGDWLEDGRHLREVQHAWLTWVTVRYVWIDGNYPLVPWLVFPILGIVLGAVDWARVRAGRWFALLLPLALACQAYAFWADAHEDSLDPALLNTWVPTSIPFVLLGATSSLAVLTGLFGWQASRRGLPRFLAPLAAIGRTSLTHYLLHICLVFALLRHFWPDEDWPLRVGLLCFLGYVVVAIPVTGWWLRFFTRGPAEKLLALAAGELSSPSVERTPFPRHPHATAAR